uniref:Uncharacterized protein n=1 Tax=Lepeophtheirus salmonis TaxID=72036 RepID=A0A0K2TD74_LEPSM
MMDYSYWTRFSIQGRSRLFSFEAWFGFLLQRKFQSAIIPVEIEIQASPVEDKVSWIPSSV